MQNNSQKISNSSPEAQALKQQLDGMNEFNFDESVLDAYLAAIADQPSQQCAIPDPAKAFADFQAAHPAAFSTCPKEEPKVPLPVPKKSTWRPKLKKAVTLAVAVAMIATMATMASGKYKPERVAVWGNEIFRFQDPSAEYDAYPELENRSGSGSPYSNYSNTVDSNDHDIHIYTPKVDTVQEAMAHFDITEPLLPTWLPKDFQSRKPSVTVYYDAVQNTADFLMDQYAGTGKQKREFHAYAYLIGHETASTKKGMVFTYCAGGLTYTITKTPLGVEAATQTKDRKIFFTGTVSIWEMQKIIDSVYANK